MNRSLHTQPGQVQATDIQLYILLEMRDRAYEFFRKNDLGKIVRNLFHMDTQVWETMNQLVTLFWLIKIKPEGKIVLTPEPLFDLWLELSRSDLYEKFCEAVLDEPLPQVLQAAASAENNWFSSLDEIKAFIGQQTFFTDWCWVPYPKGVRFEKAA